MTSTERSDEWTATFRWVHRKLRPDDWKVEVRRLGRPQRAPGIPRSDSNLAAVTRGEQASRRLPPGVLARRWFVTRERIEPDNESDVDSGSKVTPELLQTRRFSARARLRGTTPRIASEAASRSETETCARMVPSDRGAQMDPFAPYQCSRVGLFASCHSLYQRSRLRSDGAMMSSRGAS
jgi:hypothetical protein